MYPRKWVYEKYIKDGEPFSSAGIYPLVAGCDKDGKCTFVGSTYLPYRCPKCTYYFGILFAVAEGMRIGDLRLEVECCQQKALWVSYNRNIMALYCLRYAPDAYPDNPNKLYIGDTGVDATGPFSWRTVRSQPVHHSRNKPVYRRVLNVEEAASLIREGVPVYDEKTQNLKYASDIGSDSQSDTSDSFETVDEDEEWSSHDTAGGEDGGKQFNEKERRHGAGPLDPGQLDTAETSGLIHVGEINPDEGETVLGSGTESEGEDFVSFIEEEEDVDSRPSGEANRVELESQSSSNAPLTCGGRINTGESAKEPVGESEHSNISKAVRAGKY